MNCAPVNVSVRVLRETFLLTFKGCVQEAGAISVMAIYNEIDGVPSHANRWLLRDVLRKEWGFKGFVVSDYYSIWELQLSPRHARPFRRRRQEEACASGGQSRREHRAARARLLFAPRRTGEEEACSRNRSSTNSSRRC